MHNQWGVVAKHWATAVLVAGLGWVGNTSAAFIDQGDGTILDTTTNLEWEQNANHGPFTVPGAVNYADTLTLAGGGWHLALIDELLGLYNDLIAAGVCTGANCTGNIGGFTGIQLVYWSSTVPTPEFNLNFVFATGNQFVIFETFQFSAWAVRPAEVVVVPEPQTVALLLAGLGLLGWRTRRR